MGKETKIGLVVVAVLAVFLGAFVIQRFRRPTAEKEVVAENAAPQGELGEPNSDLLESSPVVVETGGFSSDVSSGDETDGMGYPQDEALLDVPMGPGTVGTDGYNNGSNDDYNDTYRESGTVEEPSHWETRRSTTGGQSFDQASWNNSGTSELGDPALEEEAPLEPATGSDNHAWESSTPVRTETVRSSAPSTTAVVDDARSSGGYEESVPSTPNLFDGASEELPRASTTAAPPAETVEPQRSLPATSLDTQQWIVREGDSFWSISRQVYGSGRYFKALARWNVKAVPNPARMRTGTVLETPPLALLAQVAPESVAREAASTTHALPGLEGLSVPEQAGAFAGPLGRKYYRVGRTDTLFGISKQTLGQGGRWKELFELNGDILEDPDRLAPGMILRLPSTAVVEEILSSRPESGVIR